MSKVIPPPKKVQQAVQKVLQTSRRCRDACAGADALIQTYWPRDGLQVTPNGWESHHLRVLADAVFGLAHTLVIRLELLQQQEPGHGHRPTPD